MRFRGVAIGLVAIGALTAGCGDYGSKVTGPQSGSSRPKYMGALVGQAPGGDVRSSFQVVQGTGDITAAVAQFRGLLGDPLNGAKADDQKVGRREINWDGVKAEFTNVNTFPADFFNARGANFAGPGTGFRNSDNDFSDLNLNYGVQFNAFSQPKTFAPVGSPEMEVDFTVAGSTTPAAVTGFGIVFSDVDREGSTSIKLFDAKGRSLGQYHPPVRSDANGLSFIGVVFDAPIVAKVVIKAGQAPIDAGLEDVSDGGNRDLVVTDDFLYGEPHALQ